MPDGSATCLAGCLDKGVFPGRHHDKCPASAARREQKLRARRGRAQDHPGADDPPPPGADVVLERPAAVPSEQQATHATAVKIAQAPVDDEPEPELPPELLQQPKESAAGGAEAGAREEKGRVRNRRNRDAATNARTAASVGAAEAQVALSAVTRAAEEKGAAAVAEAEGKAAAAKLAVEQEVAAIKRAAQEELVAYKRAAEAEAAAARQAARDEAAAIKHAAEREAADARAGAAAEAEAAAVAAAKAAAEREQRQRRGLTAQAQQERMAALMAAAAVRTDVERARVKSQKDAADAAAEAAAAEAAAQARAEAAETRVRRLEEEARVLQVKVDHLTQTKDPIIDLIRNAKDLQTKETDDGIDFDLRTTQKQLDLLRQELLVAANAAKASTPT